MSEYRKSEATDTDQSVALIVAKVTIDVMEMSIDTDSDHVSSYGDMVRRVLQCDAAMCYILQHIIVMVALC